MAFVLKRITNPYEAEKCCITKEWIIYPDYYYYDTETGDCVSFDYYYDRRLQEKREAAMPYVERAMSNVEYQVMMKEREREYLEKTLFDRPIIDNGHLMERGDED